MRRKHACGCVLRRACLRRVRSSQEHAAWRARRRPTGPGGSGRRGPRAQGSSSPAPSHVSAPPSSPSAAVPVRRSPPSLALRLRAPLPRPRIPRPARAPHTARQLRSARRVRTGRAGVRAADEAVAAVASAERTTPHGATVSCPRSGRGRQPSHWPGFGLSRQENRRRLRISPRSFARSSSSIASCPEGDDHDVYD